VRGVTRKVDYSKTPSLLISNTVRIKKKQLYFKEKVL